MSKRFKYSDTGKISSVFEKLESQSFGIAAQGLYDGAGVMADTIRAETPKREGGGDLASSLFVSEFKRSYNSVDTVIGYAGYDSKGTPNPLKAAVLESGTQDGSHKATHFFSRAVRKATSAVNKAIEQRIDEQINNITKG